MPNEHSNTPSPGQRPQTISLSQIHDLPGVFNPKPVESKLGSMILSIQNNGVMEPVILRDRGDGQYQLLSGYRRRVASERAGKKDIPAFVYEMTMQEAIAYRKAVKDNPKSPIPGKLVDPADKSKDAEKPAALGRSAGYLPSMARGSRHRRTAQVRAAEEYHVFPQGVRAVSGKARQRCRTGEDVPCLLARAGRIIKKSYKGNKGSA